LRVDTDIYAELILHTSYDLKFRKIKFKSIWWMPWR